MSIESYFSRLSDIKNKIAPNQYDVLARTFIVKVLNTLSMNFNHIVAVIFNHIVDVIQEIKIRKILSIEELQESLILYEQRMNKKLENTLEKDIIEKVLQMQLHLRGNNEANEQSEFSQMNPSYNNRGG